jgi:phage nucleotide-binding protein
MQYLDGIGTNDPINSDNALVLGTALHTGIEKDVKTAIEQYYMSFPIIDDSHISEAIKLEYLIPKAKAVLPSGEYEVEINDDDFHGFIDLLAPATVFERGVELPDTYDIYDFKYSNNQNHYKDSRQLHLYKYFFEKNNPGKRIRNLYFLFVPKVSIKQKKTEDLQQFRQRIKDELKETKVKTVQIEFDYTKVIDFLLLVKSINETAEFPQNKGWFCRYCEFEEYCMKGWNYFMKLPSTERRNIEKVDKRVMWIYGVPFCGKTTFANAFPDPLMLNTDGNIKFVDAPYIRIKDEIKVEGRMTKKTLAWQVFKDVIDELEKKENNFKTIIVDLVEDMYEYCRLFMYDQMGIKHESDDSFKAWDMVRGEFLNTLKRLMALDYENIILISHEDTSKDITKKGGDKITAIKPNMQDKVALKVAGMVDIVARIVADGDVRTFNFKSNEVIFGGGRLKTDAKDIPLDVNALFAVYDEANRNAVRKAQGNAQRAESTKANDTPNEETPSETATEVRKSRRRKVADDEPVTEETIPEPSDKDAPPFDTENTEAAEAPSTEEQSEPAEKPVRTRKRRTSTTTENN